MNKSTLDLHNIERRKIILKVFYIIKFIEYRIYVTVYLPLALELRRDENQLFC